MSDENKFFEPDRPGRPSSQKNVASNFKRDGFPESAAGLASGVIFSNESPASSSSSSSDSEDTGDFQPKDAFVLFNQAERGVQEIVRELEAYRITLYFYGRDVTFGENWLNRESAELKNCRCVLLFLGQAGWGPTHRELALQAADQGKLIIPVLLAKPTDAADLNVGGLFSELRYFELFNPSVTAIRKLASEIRQRIGAADDISTTVTVGNGFHPIREASPDGKLLNAEIYADVVADVVRAAGDDETFCMAILGPWGRGKTFLMRLVSEKLKGKKRPDNAQASNFVTVNFSAWKCRTTHEAWSFLYESIYSEAAKCGWVVPVRTTMLRHGLWPAVAILLTLTASLSTLSQKVWLGHLLISLVGLLGVVYLAVSMTAVWRAGKNLKSRYWDLPRHQERLGLQFAIGEDLTSLLTGWMPASDSWGTAWHEAFLRHPLSTFGYAAAVGLLSFTAAATVGEKTLENLTLGPVVLALFTAITAAALLPLLAFVRGVVPNRKVLLVVDDLDRCHPDQMLEMIECLQLFLDDTEIRKRLKIIMLIEEDILRNAIGLKYRQLVSGVDQNAVRENQLITDNFEKLFLVWLRLEALTEEELRSVFKNVCQSLNQPTELKKEPSPGPPVPPVPPVPPDDDRDDRDNSTPGLGLNSVSEPVQSSAPATSAAMPVSEQEVILSSINRIRLRAGRTSWGPRSVRSFVFRYTLARHLLIRMEIPFEPWELIDALLAAESREDIVADAGKTGVLQQIARQVS
jgi:hypothetical protein